jgi:AGCS family alanine or glycine:cation symporter
MMAGGPMYVLERGLKCRWLGVMFAAFTAVAAFGIGNMVQANSITQLVKETYHAPVWMTGAVLTTITAMVILGGIRSIAKVCEKLVPFMALFSIIGCLILMVVKFATISETLMLIFKTAFTGQAAVGGFAGAGIREVMRYGIARGFFSNESGLGSAPIVAAAAQTSHPVRQALVSATGTFWDTVVVCALMGVVMVNSGYWTEGLNGAALTKAVFNDLPVIGPLVLSVSLLTFVFSTILGWSYYGERAVEYLWGERAVQPYRWLWVAAVMVGSVMTLKIIWSLADITNALMAIPNLIALLALHKVAVDHTHQFLWKK